MCNNHIEETQSFGHIRRLNDLWNRTKYIKSNHFPITQYQCIDYQASSEFGIRCIDENGPKARILYSPFGVELLTNLESEIKWTLKQ